MKTIVSTASVTCLSRRYQPHHHHHHHATSINRMTSTAQNSSSSSSSSSKLRQFIHKFTSSSSPSKQTNNNSILPQRRQVTTTAASATSDGNNGKNNDDEEASTKYKIPPDDISVFVTRPDAPSISLSPSRTQVLYSHKPKDNPPVAELARKELKLGGETRCIHPERGHRVWRGP